MYNFSEYSKVYTREQYYNDEIFPEGMKVKNGNDQVGTIIRRGPNYVICLDENHKTFRSWISDISEVHELGTDETREWLQDLTPGQKKERYGKTKTPKWSTTINKRKSTQKEMYNDSYSENLVKRSAAGIGGEECFGEVENKQEVSDEFASSLMDAAVSNLSRGGIFEGSMKQARKNVGADSCWDGYKAKGTKKKGGKVVPNCVKEEDLDEKKLDPVGKEDGDVDNDGDKDSSDKYLMKRRKAIGKAIATKKEEFSDWRTEMGLEEKYGKKKCNETKEGTDCDVHGKECCPEVKEVEEGCGCDGPAPKKMKKA
tara:strand:+ start:891 stop:1829 length:939 start_codon:yes stop_codon:yes gene_type:complete